MSERFKVGDVVVLKCGGPEMVIDGRAQRDDGAIGWRCVWLPFPQATHTSEGIYSDESLAPATALGA